MTYTFARVSAVVGLDVGDYFRAGYRWKIRLHEKGGQRRTVPVHHKAKEYLDAYINKAGILTRPGSWRSARRRSFSP